MAVMMMVVVVPGDGGGGGGDSIGDGGGGAQRSRSVCGEGGRLRENDVAEQKIPEEDNSLLSCDDEVAQPDHAAECGIGARGATRTCPVICTQPGWVHNFR